MLYQHLLRVKYNQDTIQAIYSQPIVEQLPFVARMLNVVFEMETLVNEYAKIVSRHGIFSDWNTSSNSF